MAYFAFADAAALLLGFIGIILAAFAAEATGPVSRWIGERNGFVDRGQSPLVRRVAVRLGSRRPKARMNAVELLRDMRDPTAVPALLRGIQRYDRDPRLLEALVDAVSVLGDPRAVPVLRPLTRGRNQSLMEAARSAIRVLDPGGTLLRAAESGPPASASLLTPANGSGARSELLVRPVPETQKTEDWA